MPDEIPNVVPNANPKKMSDVTLQRIAVTGLVVGVLAAATAAVALTESLLVKAKIGIFTTDDQPVTLGGGSLHLRPETGWTVSSNTATHTSLTDYTQVEWACTANDPIQTSPLASGFTVTIVYKQGGDYNTLEFSKSAAYNLSFVMTKQGGNPVMATMLRHLVDVGEHAKSQWKVDSISSTVLNPAISCPGKQDPDFYLHFK